MESNGYDPSFEIVDSVLSISEQKEVVKIDNHVHGRIKLSNNTTINVDFHDEKLNKMNLAVPMIQCVAPGKKCDEPRFVYSPPLAGTYCFYESFVVVLLLLHKTKRAVNPLINTTYMNYLTE